MTRPTPLPSAAAVLALAMVAASGLVACGGGTAADQIPPVVLTEDDGVLRGPDEGATPVQPPSPATAGDARTESEAGPDEEPPAPTEDDDPDPPPPAPNDDGDHDDVGEAEAPEVDDPPDADDDAGDDDGDDDGDGEDGDD